MASRFKGVSGTFEFALRFTRWAQLLGREPTAKEIEKAFMLGNAQAYRYLTAWKDANDGYGENKSEVMAHDGSKTNGIGYRANDL